jgi:threonine-phosphate decarboxylase
VLCTPCFCEYQDRATEYRKSVLTIPLGGDFRVSARLLEDRVQAHDVIVLGNPNNPTGRRIDQQELLNISLLAANRNAFLVLDEAFFEFCPDDYDSIRLLYGQEHVCIIRAATKFFGLPGLRLGYGYAVSHIARNFHQAALPWHVNALADLAGQVILQETDFIHKTKAYVAQQRAEMLAHLRTISEIHVYDTDANFVLIKLLETDEETIFQQLLRRGLLIRKASSFDGLDRSYIRIAIKDCDSNQRLLLAFHEIFGLRTPAGMPMLPD